MKQPIQNDAFIDNFIDVQIECASEIVLGGTPSDEETWNEALAFLFSKSIERLIVKNNINISIHKVRLTIIAKIIKKLIHQIKKTNEQDGGEEYVRIRGKLLKRPSESVENTRPAD